MKTKQKSKKLPIEFKRKWIKALRSGDYKQTTGGLYSKLENAYCCLGVACVINGINKRFLKNEGTIPAKFSSMPQILIESDTTNPVSDTLIQMNDSEKKTFSEIADHIQKNL